MKVMDAIIMTCDMLEKYIKQFGEKKCGKFSIKMTKEGKLSIINNESYTLNSMEFSLEEWEKIRDAIDSYFKKEDEIFPSFLEKDY